MSLLDALFPVCCPICGEPVARGAILCSECAAAWPPQPVQLPMQAAHRALGVCTAVYSYEGAVRSALHAFKFRGASNRSIGFGRLMAQAVPVQAFDAVTFVPMDRKRQRERGYNQAELLARSCARALQTPCRALLLCTRAMGVQHERSAAERLRNTQGAFAAAPLHGEHILLCDDIRTTGATLAACAQALLDAGAGAVCGICVAYRRK